MCVHACACVCGQLESLTEGVHVPTSAGVCMTPHPRTIHLGPPSHHVSFLFVFSAFVGFKNLY